MPLLMKKDLKNFLNRFSQGFSFLICCAIRAHSLKYAFNSGEMSFGITRNKKLLRFHSVPKAKKVGFATVSPFKIESVKRNVPAGSVCSVPPHRVLKCFSPTTPGYTPT